MARTIKANPKAFNGGGCREYWTNRPHNKGGSVSIGNYQKRRTAKAERHMGRVELMLQKGEHE